MKTMLAPCWAEHKSPNRTKECSRGGRDGTRWVFRARAVEPEIEGALSERGISMWSRRILLGAGPRTRWEAREGPCVCVRVSSRGGG